MSGNSSKSSNSKIMVPEARTADRHEVSVRYIGAIIG